MDMDQPTPPAQAVGTQQVWRVQQAAAESPRHIGAIVMPQLHSWYDWRPTVEQLRERVVSADIIPLNLNQIPEAPHENDSAIPRLRPFRPFRPFRPVDRVISDVSADIILPESGEHLLTFPMEKKLNSLCPGYVTDIDSDCSICLSTMQEKEVRSLPCIHTFHVECIDMWLKKSARCPLCRRELNDDPLKVNIFGEFSDDDIRLVVEQAETTRENAIASLRRHDGDTADAILSFLFIY